jgi:Ran GTPase-activating protein (RanGAP) involved in mRNA processing and transport
MIVDAIIRNKNIRRISLRQNEIDDEAARHFGEVFTRLSIDLNFLDLTNNNISDDGGEFLANGLAHN